LGDEGLRDPQVADPAALVEIRLGRHKRDPLPIRVNLRVLKSFDFE
jgi:hypothetical protein